MVGIIVTYVTKFFVKRQLFYFYFLIARTDALVMQSYDVLHFSPTL